MGRSHVLTSGPESEHSPPDTHIRTPVLTLAPVLVTVFYAWQNVRMARPSRQEILLEEAEQFPVRMEME
jgi:hypothetical protein